MIGVMPPEFEYPSPRFVVWLPMGPSLAASQQTCGTGQLRIFRSVFRLAPQASLAQAQREADTVAARLARQYPESHEGVRLVLTPIYERLVGDSRRPLLVLMGAVALVLLIACANVANLLLARARAASASWPSAPRWAPGAAGWRGSS